MRLTQGRTCGVIGAGMAGLVVARDLTRAGFDVTVFDKSGRLGGRVATRETDDAIFNHGAPRIEARDAEFAALLARLGAQEERDGCFRRRPSMRALLEGLAEGLWIKRRIAVSTIERRGGGWMIQSEAGARHGPFGAVVVTIPAPQAARILAAAAPDIAVELGRVRMDPVLTGLLSFAEAVTLGDGLGVEEAVACGEEVDGAAKAWAVHMTGDWTQTYLEGDLAFTAVLIREELERMLGARLPATTYLGAHRWRFARASVPLGRPFAGDGARMLWAGGDWALGTGAEDAWASGRRIASEVAGTRVPA